MDIETNAKIAELVLGYQWLAHKGRRYLIDVREPGSHGMTPAKGDEEIADRATYSDLHDFIGHPYWDWSVLHFVQCTWSADRKRRLSQKLIHIWLERDGSQFGDPTLLLVIDNYLPGDWSKAALAVVQEDILLIASGHG